MSAMMPTHVPVHASVHMSMIGSIQVSVSSADFGSAAAWAKREDAHTQTDAVHAHVCVHSRAVQAMQSLERVLSPENSLVE